MSKRYGRNQKRAHRNRIAELEKALKASNVHGEQLRTRLRSADEEIDTAKKILGPYCVAFNPENRTMNVQRRDFLDVYEHERLYGMNILRHWDEEAMHREMNRPVTTSRISLPIMSVLARKGGAHIARHIDVCYNGLVYGVAIDPYAFAANSVPLTMLTKLAERMAVAMYHELKGSESVDRIRRTHTREMPDPMIETPRFR